MRFDGDGQPTDAEGANGAAKVTLDQLGWWGTALSDARSTTPYNPAPTHRTPGSDEMASLGLGLRHVSYQFDDKVSFVGFVETEKRGPGPLPELRAGPYGLG